jgi:hypothetical protein
MLGTAGKVVPKLFKASVSEMQRARRAGSPRKCRREVHRLVEAAKSSP